VRCRFLCLFGVALVLSQAALAQGSGAQSPARNGGDFSNPTQPITKVPSGVILVKGAWSSASDSATPVPEGGSVTDGVFRNQYFGMTYALPPNWTQKYEGPPPSESGRYALAQLGPADIYKGSARGSILITADDLFFTPLPVTSALELVNYSREHLPAQYKLELPPTDMKIAGQSFRFYAYRAPVSQLHFYVAATEIRCHAVQMILTSSDTKLLESLVLDFNRMKLPVDTSPTSGVGGVGFPVCIKDYARDENVISRVDPVFAERRFNSVPVRIIIDKAGKIKHIHFLSAFPEQEKAITEALRQWKFKPYLLEGYPVEVETGIMFGRTPYSIAPVAKASATE
jgi:hypothetical protein